MLAMFIGAVNVKLSYFMYFYVDAAEGPNTGNNGTNLEDLQVDSSAPGAENKNKNEVGDDVNPCQTIDIPLWICQAYFLAQVRKKNRIFFL